jgi:large subunit ribosomal protein L28
LGRRIGVAVGDAGVFRRNVSGTPRGDSEIFPPKGLTPDRISLISPVHLMSRKCSITGAKPVRGSKIHRRGLAKKKGGIGMHVTAVTPRYFQPNLQTKRVWVPELKKFVTVKATARAFKTISKNGAYKTLAAAGLVK